MQWETLPTWFWIIYYLLFFLTIVVAIIAATKNIMRNLSVLAITFSIAIPITSLFNSIGREAGKDEFEHLLSQLQQGAFWATFEVLGYVFLFIWWFLILSKGRKL